MRSWSNFVLVLHHSNIGNSVLFIKQFYQFYLDSRSHKPSIDAPTLHRPQAMSTMLYFPYATSCCRTQLHVALISVPMQRVREYGDRPRDTICPRRPRVVGDMGDDMLGLDDEQRLRVRWMCVPHGGFKMCVHEIGCFGCIRGQHLPMGLDDDEDPLLAL
jgi:hypothetical protein